MNRIEALNEVKEKVENIMEFLQKADRGEAINLADPYWDTACFTSLVDSADSVLSWVAEELEEETEEADFQENESLPSEGLRTGALVGE